MELLKQEYGYGCGVYSIANALGISDFVTPERLEESKNGNNVMQLNRWLLDDDYRFQIFQLYFKNDIQFKTPPLKINFEMCENVNYYPALIVVGVKHCPKNHMFAVRIYDDFSLHVFDSCAKEPIYFLSWDDFREKYPRIISLEIFKTWEGKEVYLQKE